MTVCIAAICENGLFVVCASDRMLTSVDNKSEPPQPKIFSLTGSICLLIAGDVSMQSEICQRVFEEVKASDYWKIRDVADLYAKHYNELRLKNTEQAILAPRGLDFDTYIRRQREMEPDLILKIDTEIQNCEIPGVEAIIAGRDKTGAHIYRIYNGNITCEDHSGFVSIGAGSWHADSQFMFAEHAKSAKFPQTLFLTYSAKKRAEAASSVGKKTDILTIGPDPQSPLGTSVFFSQEMIDDLDEIYNSKLEAENAAAKIANAETLKYLRQIIKDVDVAQQVTQEHDGGDESSDNSQKS